MASDYLTALNPFYPAAGGDEPAKKKKTAAPTATPRPPTVTPSPTPPTALGAAPISPAPVAAATVTPPPSPTPPAITPPPPPTPTPPPPPAEPSTVNRPIEYSPGSSVLRQAFRTPEAPGFGQAGAGATALPKPVGPASGVVGGTQAVNPNSRTLYPANSGIRREFDALGNRVGSAQVSNQGGGAMTLAQKADQNRFDRSFGFTPTFDDRGNRVTAQPQTRPATAKKDPYDIGPYAEESSGTFGSGKVPGQPSASNAPASSRPTATSSPRLAEADLPPGAEGSYYGGPLANPKPTPKPGGQRTASLNGLPRRRNQRAASSDRSQLFAS